MQMMDQDEHPGACLADPASGTPVPSEADYQAALAVVWTRGNGERIPLGAMTRTQIDILSGFINRNLQRLRGKRAYGLHYSSYAEKMQLWSDQIAFLEQMRIAVETVCEWRIIETLRRNEATKAKGA